VRLLDLTLNTPQENLALDEALLDAAEASSNESREVLRLWEPRQGMLVAGSSSRLADEVNLNACAARGVPVLRRASGGATILTGPGCLMYAVVLSYELRPDLRPIDQAHSFVLGTIAAALGKNISGVSRAGISDLVLGEKKFSGNSLRCKRGHFLYHGTLLYRFPLEEISSLLKMPSRQPAYREHRNHADFLTNLPLGAPALRQALITAFSATEDCPNWPRSLTDQLVAEKYSNREWNERL
jgi:lipoate-protein ligase A